MPPQQGLGGGVPVGGGPPVTGTGGYANVVPPGVPTSYNGFMPAIDPGLAGAAYQRWAADFLVDCGNGLYRVESGINETVSEAVGYGMLITVNFDNRAAFDGLWAYYRLAADNSDSDTGLMDWEVQGCNAIPTGTGAATDAELDVAMALIMAYCRGWGDAYAADAIDLINAIRREETLSSYLPNGQVGTLLKPGPRWGGASCMNPSYFAPAYYRVFSRFVEDAGFWLQLADDTYVVLNNSTNQTTGLVPDWTDIDGTDGCPNDGRGESGFRYDAVRVPWRIATDYVWWATPAAQAWLTRITNWAAAVGIQNIKDGYTLLGAEQGQSHSVVFVGSFAVGAMAHSQALADLFAAEFAGIVESRYYQLSLRTLYLLLMTGYFPAGC